MKLIKTEVKDQMELIWDGCHCFALFSRGFLCNSEPFEVVEIF